MDEIYTLNAYKDLEIEEQVQWLKALQEHFLKMLEQGELPAVEMSVLYMMFDHQHTFEKNKTIEDYKGHFLGAFSQTHADSLDAYVMSALVMVCDFLNANFEEGLQGWLQRTMISNQRIVPNSYSWAYYFQLMLEHAKVPLESVIASIQPLLKWEKYSELSILSRRSIFIWILTRFWNIKSYENSKTWLALYPSLKELSDILLEKNLLNEQMSLHFCIYHLYGNIVQTQEEWKQFNVDFDKPQSIAFEKYVKQPDFLLAKKDVSKGRKKIMLVKDRIVDNSVFKVEFSLLTSLVQEENFQKEYEISILSMSYVDKSFDDETSVALLKGLGISVVSPGMELINSMGLYYNHLQKAHLIREYIISQDTDIMIIDASCFDISNFLFSTRTAPKQIFWSHGNYVYDVAGIDKRIFHSDEADFADVIVKEGCEFEPFYAPFDKGKLAPVIQQDEVAAILETYAKNHTILGSLGRLIKVDNDEYLEAVAKIMQDNPKTIYLACGSGDQEPIRKKVSALGLSDRFFFPGYVDPHLYGYVIDMYLNTFPLSGGESLNEFMAKGGIPIILLPQEHVAIDTITKSYQEKDYERIHACNIDDYICLADKIIKDKEVQLKVKAYINDIILRQIERSSALALDFIRVLK